MRLTRLYIAVLAFVLAGMIAPLQPAAAANYLCANVSGTWHCHATPSGRAGGSWQTTKGAYANISGVWTAFYSTPTVSASNVSGSNSGNSSSGSVSTGTPGTTPGGYSIAPLTYSWSCLSGTCASISNAAAQNPTWSYSFSGVACQSSTSISGTWRVTATDAIGNQATADITVGNLTWNNTTSCTPPYLQQVTVGIGNSGGPFPLYGYSTSIGFGSISDTSFFAGGSFQEFWWNSGTPEVALTIDTTGIPQGAFTTVTINGNVYSSASASFNDDGSTCSWLWSSGGNPFGTGGSIVATFN